MVILPHSKFYLLCDRGKLGSIVNRLPTGGPEARGSILRKGGGYFSISSFVSNDPSLESKDIWPWSWCKDLYAVSRLRMLGVLPPLLFTSAWSDSCCRSVICMIINCNVSLAVHLSITLANDQLDAQIINTFITILYMYMFRTIPCSSSGGQIVLIQHLVSSVWKQVSCLKLL